MGVCVSVEMYGWIFCLTIVLCGSKIVSNFCIHFELLRFRFVLVSILFFAVVTNVHIPREMNFFCIFFYPIERQDRYQTKKTSK